MRFGILLGVVGEPRSERRFVRRQPEDFATAADRLDGKAEVRVHNLIDPLDFLDGECVDIVVCALALDHVEALASVFAEFSRVLEVGGTLLFSLGHPAHDYTKHGGSYFETELIEERFPSFDTVIPYYRRPIDAILNPLIKSGFRLDTLAEPRPVEACRAAHPETYDRLSTRPSFVCIRARKGFR